ncbi:MAG: hypothetical protein K0R13_2863 [Propionibacteriaceae bacterium]|nr:hypothetical protein [Propionibacteriaceae bacterium]
MVFSCPEPGRYFGFRLAGTAHKEGPNSRVMGTAHATDARSAEGSARHTRRAGATPMPRGARGVVPRNQQSPGGWWYHPAR